MKKLLALMISAILLLPLAFSLTAASATDTTYTEIPYTAFNSAYGDYNLTVPANTVEITLILSNLTVTQFEEGKHADVTFPYNSECTQIMQMQYYYGLFPGKYSIIWDDGIGAGFAIDYLNSDIPIQNCTWSLNAQTGIMTFSVNGVPMVNSTIADPPTTYQNLAPNGAIFHNGSGEELAAATDGNATWIVTTS
jgi:hypothetical protein